MALAASRSLTALTKPKWAHRRVVFPSRIVVSRATDTATSTTGRRGSGETGRNGSLTAIAKSKVIITAGAVITIVRKQRLSRDEQMVNAVDVLSDLTGSKIFLQLVSADVVGKRSKESFIKDWALKAGVVADKVQYTADFDIGGDFGEPGALLIRNSHQAEFYLESIALQLPSGTVYFPCHSYIAPSAHDRRPRVFFSNKVYLPWETPAGLVDLREQELKTLRGNGKGERKSWDRIYDYAPYNDLGDSDKKFDLNRPILGGKEFPYPRRVRTGRAPCKSDATKEEKVENGEAVYVPRDESFEPIKQTNFTANQLRGLVHKVVPSIRDYFDATPGEFDTLREIEGLYQEGIEMANAMLAPGEEMSRERNRFLDGLPIADYYRELIRSSTTPTSLLKYPLPRILSKDRFAWMRDDEFARQALAGVNPVVISCLEEFPPRSGLNPDEFGSQESAMKAEHIEIFLEGLEVAEAVKAKRLFVVDYHDTFLPYVARINALEGRKMYATRTLFFMRHDGVLMPVAIELSLPPPAPGADGSKRVFTPGKEATSFWLWQLAKLHVCTNDSGYHQLVSHWLRTHACTEPYIIATYRQLSALHPIAKLLHPHFRYTMEINAAARQNLIAAGGVIESTFTPGKYALEMSAVVYESFWRFDKESLPEDLIRRGMAVRDENAPHGLRLRIADYPFAADGLLVWSSIEQWCKDYVSLYYTDAATIVADVELQQWWTEIRTKGHPDKQHEQWWPELTSPESLIHILTTMIWMASGHHAAVNFGQYDYTGFVPNKPCLARRLVPEPGDPEFAALLRDPHKFMLETLPSQEQATVLMMVVESLSTHSPDEEYLGYNGMHTNWSSDERAVHAFKAFSARLAAVDRQIHERNADLSLKHRSGAGTLPYSLLLQKSDAGITMRGIPNSISI